MQLLCVRVTTGRPIVNRQCVRNKNIAIAIYITCDTAPTDSSSQVTSGISRV